MLRLHCESDTLLYFPFWGWRGARIMALREGINVSWKSCFGAVERIPHQPRPYGL